MNTTIEYIELSGGVMPWALITMLATGHWSSHVVFGLSNGNVLDALPGKGVSERKESKSFLRWKKRYTLGILTPNQRHELYKLAKLQEGKPYDWPWIVGYAFKERDWNKPDRWVCYEFVAWAIRGIWPISKSLSRVTGRHLEQKLGGIGLDYEWGYEFLLVNLARFKL